MAEFTVDQKIKILDIAKELVIKSCVTEISNVPEEYRKLRDLVVETENNTKQTT